MTSFSTICIKWQSLPFWEAAAGDGQGSRSDTSRQMDDKDGPAIPMARLFLPAVQKVFGGRGRAWTGASPALRCVEAVRLYAAGHDGKLPASLDDIKDVPFRPTPSPASRSTTALVGDRAFFCPRPSHGQNVGNSSTRRRMNSV